MAIRSFIRLSREFAASVEHSAPNPFLARRIIQEYDKMETLDRLRVLGIVNHINYSDRMASPLIGRPPEQELKMCEYVYQEQVFREKGELLYYLQDSKIASPQPYRDRELYGCIPVFIALDLADEVRKPKPADKTPPCPV